MDTSNQPEHHVGPSAAIIGVAMFQFLSALPVLFICGIYLWQAIWVTHEIRSSPIGYYVFGIPFLCGCIAVVTSAGLFLLREFARQATLYLATFPAFACLLFLMRY